jgi:NAD(P)-dependent dehydrogenase (short-subunit alcohol dehydrogenase family)
MPFADISKQPLTKAFSLTERVAVITGGANGIGEAICHRLAEAGAKVVIGDLAVDKARAIADAIIVAGGHAIAVETDATKPDAQDALAARAVAEFGRLDIWVNDAGMYPIKPALDLTQTDWERVISLNLGGMFFGSQAAARRMHEHGGVIINIASSLGYHAVDQQASYVTSKFGARGLTAALALEWGKLGIRVVAVGPGMIDVPSMQKAAGDMGQASGTEVFDTYAKHSIAGRAGVPDDIARAVVFVASDAAMFITGSTLLVDGGEVASCGAA